MSIISRRIALLLHFLFKNGLVDHTKPQNVPPLSQNRNMCYSVDRAGGRDLRAAEDDEDLHPSRTHTRNKLSYTVKLLIARRRHGGEGRKPLLGDSINNMIYMTFRITRVLSFSFFSPLFVMTIRRPSAGRAPV